MKCSDCGRELKVIRGLGEKNGPAICPNTKCPSRYKHVNCPKCKHTEKTIAILGIGHQHFTCKNCGHKWSSIPGQ